MTAEKKDTRGKIVAFSTGAALGAGLAILYAPKKGSEVREKIATFTEDAVDKIKSYSRDTQEKIKTSFTEGVDTLVEKKQIFATAIEAGKEALQKEKDRIASQ